MRADRFRYTEWARTTLPPLPDAAGADPTTPFFRSACWADQRCVVVGTYPDRSGNDAAALWTLSGTRWSVVRAPLPADAATNPAPLPWQVSCGADGLCAAYAGYTAHRDGRDVDSSLLWVRSGGTWTVAVPPVPADGSRGSAVIHGVGCAGTICAARGYYEGDQGIPALWTLTEDTWAVVRAPLPANAVRVDLGAVQALTCAAGGTCIASGLYLANPALQSGRALWQLGASGWTVTEATTADGAGYAENNDFATACGADGTCFATLDVLSAGVWRTDLWTLDGGRWGRTPLPLPAAADSAADYTVDEVACSSLGHCTAVGQYTDSAGDLQGALWVRAADGAWSVTRAPLPADAAQNPDPVIRRLVCSASGTCFAIGGYVYHRGGGDVDEFGGHDRLRWTYSNGVWSMVRMFPGSAPSVGTLSTSCGSDFCALGGLGTLWTSGGGTWRTATADSPGSARDLVLAPGGGLAIGWYTDRRVRTVDAGWVYVG